MDAKFIVSKVFISLLFICSLTCCKNRNDNVVSNNSSFQVELKNERLRRILNEYLILTQNEKRKMCFLTASYFDYDSTIFVIYSALSQNEIPKLFPSFNLSIDKQTIWVYTPFDSFIKRENDYVDSAFNEEVRKLVNPNQPGTNRIILDSLYCAGLPTWEIILFKDSAIIHKDNIIPPFFKPPVTEISDSVHFR